MGKRGNKDNHGKNLYVSVRRKKNRGDNIRQYREQKKVGSISVNVNSVDDQKQLEQLQNSIEDCCHVINPKSTRSVSDAAHQQNELTLRRETETRPFGVSDALSNQTKTDPAPCEVIVLDENDLMEGIGILPDSTLRTESLHITEASCDIHNSELPNNNATPSCDATSVSSNVVIQLASPKSGKKSKISGRKIILQKDIEGRRLVDVQYLFKSLKGMGRHKPYTCGFEDMELESETIYGMRSSFTFKCTKCGTRRKLYTEDKSDNSKLCTNTAAAMGIISAGIGFTQFESLCGALNMPTFAPGTYQQYHDLVAAGISDAALKLMEEAVAEERRLAIEAGDVSEDGTPFILVVVDGSWPKRVYRGGNYSSLFGTAVIIGYRTGKVIFVGIRSKYCQICHRAALREEEPREHNCIKNWGSEQSSSSMEADIIVEGFIQSYPVYGIRYKWFIGDGDSSVYQRILEARPYPEMTVEKIECRNHLLRNFCTKLRTFARGGKNGPPALKRTVLGKVMKMRTGVTEAIRYRKKSKSKSLPEKAAALRKDIENNPFHCFGDHSKCDPYFCDGSNKENEENLVPKLKEEKMWDPIYETFTPLIVNSRSLIFDVDSNSAEGCFSLANRFLGGKRLFVSKSYEPRMNCTVVQFNTGELQRMITKGLIGLSPGKYTKLAEQKQKKKNRTICKRKTYSIFKPDQCNNPDYGSNCARPDMDPKNFEIESKKYLENLKMSESDIISFERQTVLQFNDEKFRERHRKMLTASNFGSVCSKLPTTLCDNIVVGKLYVDLSTKESVQHGIVNEKNALAAVASTLDIQIEPCGLFIDKEYNYLGASPDGLVGCDTIVEVKCLYTGRDEAPDDAIKKGFCNFWRVNKKKEIGEVNKNHKWYYQIQGQLHIAGKKTCIFGVWTKKAPHIKIEFIEKDDSFWEKMKDKLIRFYMDCLLHELVDPRRKRGIKAMFNPPYIVQAHLALVTKQEENKRKKIVAQLAALAATHSQIPASDIQSK